MFRSSRYRQREWMSEGGGGGKGKSVPPSQTSHRRKHGCYNLFSWLSMKEKGSGTGAWVRLDPLPLTPTLSPICYLVFFLLSICPSFAPALHSLILIQNPCVATLHCSTSLLCLLGLWSYPTPFSCCLSDLRYNVCLCSSLCSSLLTLLLQEYFWDDPSVGLSAAPEWNL